MMQLDDVLESLKRLDWHARVEACARLGELRDARALPPLLACLEDEDTEVRSAAAHALGASGLLEALPALLNHLLDANRHVREAVWQALAALGPAVFPALVERLEHESPEMRQSACRALGLLRDARALEPLLTRLEDDNILVRQAACVALTEQGDPRAVAPLIAQLNHARAPVRIAACVALGRLRDARAIDALLPLLGDEDFHLRQAAVNALEALGEGRLGRTVTQALHGNPQALEAVAELAAAGATWLIAPLTARLSDENARVRQAAATALGKIGAPCLEAVIERLAENDPELRRMVYQVLRLTGGPRAINLLMEKFADPRWRNRQVLYGALTAVGPSGAGALLAHVETPDAAARQAVVQVLGTLKDPRAVPRILGRLNDGSEAVRASACEALGFLGELSAVPGILGCIRDISPPVRQAASRALCRLGAVTAVDVLVPMLFDPKEEFAALAFQTLSELNELLAPTAHALLCGKCLTRFIWKVARVGGVGEAPYLTCRQCGRAGNGLRAVNLVVAVLDAGMSAPCLIEHTTARVHALGRNGLFDFDGVEVVQASDYQVERFCMMVGNDTDPERSARYREMLCQVWHHATLSENSLNVLRSIFGRVIFEG